MMDEREKFMRMFLDKMLELRSEICRVCSDHGDKYGFKKCDLVSKFEKYRTEEVPKLHKDLVMLACITVMNHLKNEANIVAMMGQEECGKINDLRLKFAKDNPWMFDGTVDRVWGTHE